MAERVKREFTKGEIDRAGGVLVPWWKHEAEPETVGWAYTIVENWRNSHSMPLLTFRVNLQRRAKRVEPDAIVAQRLKRFASVMNKLVREPHMKLSQMHDLGGCRAIVSDVKYVENLYELYRARQESEGALKCYDYLRDPKPDGYRGIHVVGRYSARVKTNEAWNGHRIEIQLRSQLQHAFATAVETVTTFTRLPLKFGAGPEEWRRFFSLMGTALAIREGTARVPGTPSDDGELFRELNDLTNALTVRQRLQGWTDAIKESRRQDTENAKWLLLVLDVQANTIRVKGYVDARKARQDLAGIEKTSRSGNLDAVLVWVRSVRYLKSAYPNYYADTRAFLAALDFALTR